MNSEIINDRLTIKDLIFTKALPNYKIPVPTDGYKIFPCTDCGDKFLFESSYDYHINRKSLKISYFCRHCMAVTIFYNRCKLLSHIRSHAFKTATITVTDLKLEPLPLEHFNFSILKNTKNQVSGNQNNTKQVNICYECNQDINNVGITYKDRAAHYTQYTKEVHSCPVCKYSLPTVCALEAHLRIHLHIPPFFCPECGMHLSNKVASYPFDHECEGFKMMRACTRIKCKIDTCKVIFKPNEYNYHFKTHFKKVYRCSFCLEVWYNEPRAKCSLCKNGNISCYMQCPLCPRKLFSVSLTEKHYNSHSINIKEKLNNQVYPCISCKIIFHHMHNLIYHHINIHTCSYLKNLLSKVVVNAEPTKINKSPKNVYHRVIKKCSKCLRSFTYRCLYENIKSLPNECPYKCSANNDSQDSLQTKEANESLQIVCFLCKKKISKYWANIKTHYAEYHKNHKCLDIKVMVKRLDIKCQSKNIKNVTSVIKNKSKNNKVKANKVSLITKEKDSIDELNYVHKDPNVCIICNCNYQNSTDLENHLITHRDPCMAYQCLECGQCFVVKPSFSTHLLLEHGINDVQDYIDKKPCYNEMALLKYQNINSPVVEPLKENQCQICREQFDNSNDLEKHFRIHGMAFLMKNAHKNHNP